jgi:hypothetical protein
MLGTNDADRLTATPQLWIKYRDANFSVERALYEGESGSAPYILAVLKQ